MVKTILGGDFLIFSEVESEKMLVFRCFVELTTELEKSSFHVRTSDMPGLAVEHLF